MPITLVLIKLSGYFQLSGTKVFPAREKKIKGISSNLLLKKIKNSSKELIQKNQIKEIIINSKAKVFAILGAGDIGLEVKKILL